MQTMQQAKHQQQLAEMYQAQMQRMQDKTKQEQEAAAQAQQEQQAMFGNPASPNGQAKSPEVQRFLADPMTRVLYHQSPGDFWKQYQAVANPPPPKQDIRQVGHQLVSIGPDGKPHVVYSAPQGEGDSMPKPPAGYRWSEDGNLAPIPGGPADPARKGGGGTVITNPDGSTTIIPAGKANTQELTNAGFYQRMVEADKDLGELEKTGYDPTNVRDKLTAGGMFNALSSDEGQKYHQAAMNWVRANLRKESGAAIGKEEAAQEFRNYFPQFGDSPGVIEQKAQMRQVVENAMRLAAGPAIGKTAQPQATQADGSVDELLSKYGVK